MIKFLLFGAFFLAWTPIPANADGHAYAISISTKQPTVVAGEKIRIEVRTTNIALSDMVFAHVNGDDQAEFDNEVHVTDGNDNQPPKTRFYSLLTGDTANLPPLPNGYQDGPISSGESSTMLAPGKSYADDFFLNELYELNAPGTYTVQVASKIYTPNGSYYVYSNKLSITVVAAN